MLCFKTRNWGPAILDSVDHVILRGCSMRSMLTKLGLLATIMFSFVDGIATGQQTKGQTAPFYIGTYTGGESQGIYRSELDLLTGQLRKPELVAELKNPSFIAIHRNQTELFAVSEVSAAEAGQQVFAYRILPRGRDRVRSAAAAPAHPAEARR